MAERRDNEKDLQAAGVATPRENENLKHSRGGVTTRDDALDLGVPMLQGDPNEPIGPEDALGGMTRGDYTQRVGPETYQPFTTELVPDDERKENGPTVRLVPQRPMASKQGDTRGKKGGVDRETR